MLVAELEGVDAKAMQEAAQKLLASMGDFAAVVLATRGASGATANFVAAFSPKVCVCARVQGCAGVCACAHGRVCAHAPVRGRTESVDMYVVRTCQWVGG